MLTKPENARPTQAIPWSQPGGGGTSHALQGSRQMLQTIYIYSTQHLHYSYFNAKSLSFEMSVINTHGSNSSQASLLHTPVTPGPARHQPQRPHAKVSEHRDTLTASQTASSSKMFQNTWRTVHTANLVPQVRITCLYPGCGAAVMEACRQLCSS